METATITVLAILLGIAILYSILLKFRLGAYHRYLVRQDKHLEDALSLNDRYQTKIEIAKTLVSESSISKSEQTTIIKELL